MVIQTVKVIPSSNLRPRWQTIEVGGIPQNESEAVEYLQKNMLFVLSEVSFLKLSKTVTEYEFITKYSTKLYFPGRSKHKKLSFWRLKILARRQHNQLLRQTKIGTLPGVAPCMILSSDTSNRSYMDVDYHKDDHIV